MSPTSVASVPLVSLSLMPLFPFHFTDASENGCEQPTDPPREVESNLASLHALLPTYTQLSTSSPSSPSFLEARDELRGTLSLLEADLADLDESVRIVEERGERWGIDEAEVRKRRGFVERVRGEVRVRVVLCRQRGTKLMGVGIEEEGDARPGIAERQRR